MIRNLSLFIGLFLFLGSVGMGHAQTDDTCPLLIEDAMAAIDEACANFDRNQICYGNIQIDAALADDSLRFSTMGDIVPVSQVQSLQLEPYNAASNVWGVAVAKIQANIPATLPGQSVTLVMFGDVALENDSGDMQAFTFTSSSTANCDQAPNGMLVQTPEGVYNVEITVNGVDIMLGSTMFIGAGETDDELTFALLEGKASITAEGESQFLNGGELVQVPLNERRRPAAPPRPPQVIELENSPVMAAVPNLSNHMLPHKLPGEGGGIERPHPGPSIGPNGPVQGTGGPGEVPGEGSSGPRITNPPRINGLPIVPPREGGSGTGPSLPGGSEGGGPGRAIGTPPPPPNTGTGGGNAGPINGGTAGGSGGEGGRLPGGGPIGSGGEATPLPPPPNTSTGTSGGGEATPLPPPPNTSTGTSGGGEATPLPPPPNTSTGTSGGNLPPPPSSGGGESSLPPPPG